MRNTTVVGLVVTIALALASCATSSIPRLSDEPRILEVSGGGRYTWDETNGWVRPEDGEWGPLDHVRTQTMHAFEAGAWADALEGFRYLLEARERGAGGAGGAADASRDVNFHIGECLFQLGDYEGALPHFQAVYRRDFPAQELLDQAILRVYAIGMAFLSEDVPCEFAGIVRYGCPEYGIEVLAGPDEGLITQYPDVEFADDALIEIGRYYYEKEEYPEAVPIFDRVAAMADSEWADLAEYQASMAVDRQFRGVDYDQRTLLEAQHRFESYLEHHPRGEHSEEARAKLRELSEMQGAKNLKIAKFYLRESQPEACEIYLKLILGKYPNSAAAREARDIQVQLDEARGSF